MRKKKMLYMRWADTLGTRQKCPYMTGGRSSKERGGWGWAKHITPCTTALCSTTRYIHGECKHWCIMHGIIRVSKINEITMYSMLYTHILLFIQQLFTEEVCNALLLISGCRPDAVLLDHCLHVDNAVDQSTQHLYSLVQTQNSSLRRHCVKTTRTELNTLSQKRK